WLSAGKTRIDGTKVKNQPNGFRPGLTSIITNRARLFMSNSAALKEIAEERRRFIRDAGNLIRRLTIEFEIQLGLGSTVVPIGKKSELASPQASLCQRGACDSDAHARRLPGRPVFCDRFGRGDDAARDQTWPAFV